MVIIETELREAQAKHKEWDSFRTFVSQWELDRYLERY